MTETWTLPDTTVGSAAEQAARALEGDIVAALKSLAGIAVEGADAADFLHGQFTNAVNDMQPDEVRYAAYCTPKGRMLALLQVLRTDTGFELFLPAELVDGLLQRLRLFVLRAKVTFTDLRSERAVIGVSGPRAADLLQAELGELPKSGTSARQGELRVIAAVGSAPRYLIAGTPSALQTSWTALAADVTPVAERAWRLLDIRAGLPCVLAGTQESFVPQMANVDLIGGLSFTKGCYPGQEIVARMHYLGNLKRRMYRLRFDADDAPTPGTEIRSADGKRVGELVVAAPGPDGYEGLGVLIIEHAQTQELKLGDADLTVEPPPYSLASDS